MSEDFQADFGRTVSDYSTHRAGFPPLLFDKLGERGIGADGQRILDLGTGTGTLARGFAMRGGLPFEAALEAVTINPARMIGIDDRVGSIEVGKDADLLLWNGKPFEATSRVIGVLLDGELVLDPRPTTDD